MVDNRQSLWRLVRWKLCSADDRAMYDVDYPGRMPEWLHGSSLQEGRKPAQLHAVWIYVRTRCAFYTCDDASSTYLLTIKDSEVASKAMSVVHKPFTSCAPSFYEASSRSLMAIRYQPTSTIEQFDDMKNRKDQGLHSDAHKTFPCRLERWSVHEQGEYKTILPSMTDERRKAYNAQHCRLPQVW